MANAGEPGPIVLSSAKRTVSEAVERFLATHGEIDRDGKFHGDSEYNTYRKYRSSLRFFSSYCDEHRIVTLNDDMADALQDYRRARNIGAVTWKTERQTLSFFAFCVKRKWIATNPEGVERAAQPKAERSRAVYDSGRMPDSGGMRPNRGWQVQPQRRAV